MRKEYVELDSLFLPYYDHVAACAPSCQLTSELLPSHLPTFGLLPSFTLVIHPLPSHHISLPRSDDLFNSCSALVSVVEYLFTSFSCVEDFSCPFDFNGFISIHFAPPFSVLPSTVFVCGYHASAAVHLPLLGTWSRLSQCRCFWHEYMSSRSLGHWSTGKPFPATWYLHTLEMLWLLWKGAWLLVRASTHGSGWIVPRKYVYHPYRGSIRLMEYSD